MTKLSLNKVLFYVLFWLIVGCFSIILFAFPKSYDDWWFFFEFIKYGEDANGHHSLAMGIAESFRYHWNYDNVRIGNYIAALLLLAPKWIPSLISAICFGIGFWIMIKISGIKPGQTGKLVLISILLVFPNLWSECFFSQMYAFNYICPIPLFFGIIYIFLYERQISTLICFILSFILGAWHESFSASAIIGFIVLLTFRFCSLNKNRIIILSGLTFGLVLILIPPAIWVRSSSASTLTFSYKIFYLILIFLFILISVILSFTKRWRHCVLLPFNIITLVSSVILLGIVYYTGILRSCFPAILLSCCSLTIYASNIWSKFFNSNNLRLILFTLAGIIILGSHLIAVCMETIRIRPVMDNLTKQVLINAKDNNSIFSEIRYPWDGIKIALGRPDKTLMMPHSYSFLFFHLFYNNWNFMIVPNELKNYTSDKGIPLDCSNHIKLWNHHIISLNKSDTTFHRAKIKYGPFIEDIQIESSIFSNDFGEEFVYIVPYRSTRSHFYGDPQSIVLTGK